LRYLKGIGWQAMAAREEALTRHALGRLASVPGLKLQGPQGADGRIALFSFDLEGVDPGDAGALLDSFGIEVRVGHHCAQPLMAALGRKGLVRASLYLYNTEQEVDFLAESLLRVQKMAGRPTAKA
jgi:cysteine desulfurase/selenocysteine lyase